MMASLFVSRSVICKNAEFCYGGCPRKYNMPKTYYEAQQKQNMINYHYKSTCTKLIANVQSDGWRRRFGIFSGCSSAAAIAQEYLQTFYNNCCYSEG